MVHGVKGLFEDDKVDVQRSILFVDLFQNNPEDEYLVDSSTAGPEASLFFPE